MVDGKAGAEQGDASGMGKLDEIRRDMLSNAKKFAFPRQVAEKMAEIETGRPRRTVHDQIFDDHMELCATELAYFIHMVWDGAPPGVYEAGIGNELKRLANSVSGMYEGARWNYALTNYAGDVRRRVQQIKWMEIGRDKTRELFKKFRDPPKGQEFVRMLAENMMRLYAEGHPSPSPLAIEGYEQKPASDAKAMISRGGLKEVIERLVTYVEQENIRTGRCSDPLSTDSLKDELTGIQDMLIRQGKYKTRFDEGCWEEAISTKAGEVYSMFATPEGAAYAHNLRHWYRQISSEHRERRQRLGAMHGTMPTML